MLISVLIPCYNAERWVAEAIESALAQTWAEKEVIVVDDGSTDSSLKIIQSFGDRIRWETGPNRGGNVARNRLLELSRGDWLQYLDADDYLLPDKISNQVSFLEKNPATDVVYGPVTMEQITEKETRRDLLPIPEPHDLWILLARWFLPQTGAPLWRKQGILDVGGWKPSQPCCQEHELYLRLLIADKRFRYFGQNGAVYRQWGEQTVCKRDKPETRRRRLEIEQRAELFLRMRGELTSARLWAINQSRFQMARAAWQHDQAESSRTMSLIRASQPGFRPNGATAPLGYRVVFRAMGFRSAEFVATWIRQFRRKKGQ